MQLILTGVLLFPWFFPGGKAPDMSYVLSFGFGGIALIYGIDLLIRFVKNRPGKNEGRYKK
jgi:hypothetical protein